LKTNDEYFDSKEFRNILASYEKAVNTGQPVFMDADELAEIADFYQMQDRQEEAEKAIRQALSLSPGAIAPLTYRIHEALSQGDTDKAWKFLDQITERNEPDYVYDRGEIMIAEGRIDEADEYFRKEFSKVPPEEYQDYVVDVAGIYSEYGISEKAMEWLFRSDPENSSDFKELKARTLFGLGNYDESEQLFKELIDSDPFEKRYWSSLATVQFMKEDYQSAIESSEYALAIDPADVEGLMAKANALFRLPNFEQSAEYFNRYLKQVPDDECAWLHLGICYNNTERADEGLECLLKAAELAPDDSPYLIDIYQELGFAYSDKGDVEAAIKWLDKTDELDCDHTQMQVVKGHAALNGGDPEKAEEYFREAILDTDTPTRTLLRVIASLYDNHYVNEAYRMLQKLFTVAEEGNTEGYAYMAMCCHDLKRYDEYLQYLKQACELNPKECQQVLGHLFPKHIAPEKYYDYMVKKMNKAKNENETTD
jgi:tetratricopeptide (TPR) repeat protein